MMPGIFQWAPKVCNGDDKKEKGIYLFGQPLRITHYTVVCRLPSIVCLYTKIIQRDYTMIIICSQR